MRTAIVILAGFVLWGLCLGVARRFIGTDASTMTIATGVFLGIWFAAAALNMWTGIARAGYPFAEELPIFLLVFLLPAVVAIAVKWKFL